MFYVFQIITLLGGLALFLFGMDIMGKGLERMAGSKLQTILAKMSSTVIRGFVLGLGVTVVVQSSSAVTVMVVGFVNSGIMTLRQAIGIIMGSNVGTTITAWILSLSALEGESVIMQIFKPSTLAPALGLVGIVLYMFTKSEKKQNLGSILLGFMALMTGMDLMSGSMEFLENEKWFADLMVSFSNPILGIIAGAVLTAIIQSSSASVGILQALSKTGLVNFGAALPIILGQNIGTCVTSMLSTVGANRNARRTALVHLYFNVIGTVLFAVVFYGINAIIPWPFLENAVGPMEIALVHTFFNLGATAVLLPLNRLLEKLAYLTIAEQETPEKVTLLDERLLVTPSMAIGRARQVAVEMAQTSQQAMVLAIQATKEYSEELLAQVKELEDKTDTYEDALSSYLVKLTGTELSVHDNRELNTLLYSISDIERIADHAVAIAKAGQEMSQKNILFSQQARSELAILEKAVLDVLGSTVAAFENNDFERAMKVEPKEQVVDALVKEVKSRHVRRLRDGLCSVEYGFVLEDLLTAYGRTADHCSNVAVEMLQVAEGKLEAHEYLNALKAGELAESALYAEQFQKYQERYTFPEEN